MDDKGYAIVLGGGGAKGAYQAGVWKALHEKKIRIDAIFGTSIGAINGCMIALNETEKMIEIWQNISIDKIIDLPLGLIVDGRVVINRDTISYLNRIQSRLLKYGGADTSPLRSLINRHVDEKALRKTGIKFGICAFEFNTLKPLEIMLDDIPEGYLADYLLATSTLPGFRPTVINGKKYFDGGLNNNIPYSMAKERGYRKIIVIDVNGLGVNKRPDTEGTDTIFMKMKNDTSNILDFEKHKIDKMIFSGYYDVLKIYGEINGVNYYYKNNRKITAILNSILYSDEVVHYVYKELLDENNESGNVYFERSISSVIPHECKGEWPLVLQLLECASIFLRIPIFKLYKLEELIDLIAVEFENIENKWADATDHDDNFFKKIFSLTNTIDFFNIKPSDYIHIIRLFGSNKHEVKKLKKRLRGFIPTLIGTEIFRKVLSIYRKS